MPTKKEIRERYGDSFGEEDVIKEIAARLNPAGAEGVRSRAWQWKLDLWKHVQNEQGRWIWVPNKKDKFDLYEELGKAPGNAVYIPGPKQLAAHKAAVRTKQVSGGWRAGKSKWLAAEILPYMFIDNAQIWIVAPTYILPRFEWNYVKEWLEWLGAPITIDSHPANGRQTLELEWGARLETQTADDVTQLEGANLDAVAIAEGGLISEEVVARLRGRVLEKRGPVLISGSLDGSEPWYMEAYQEYLKGPSDRVSWHAFGIPSWENRIAFPDGENDEELLEAKATWPENLYKLKICAEVAKVEELVFPEFDKQTHVMRFQYASVDSEGFKLESPEQRVDEIIGLTTAWTLPVRGEVMLAIDPGYNGAYAVLACRKYDEQVWVIDEVYARRMMVEDVIAECKSREWWPDVTYAVMDIAGKQHDAMASHLDIWRQPEHLGFRPATNYVPVPDGIQRLRTFLRNPLNGRPRVYFDRKCRNTILEFSRYRYRLPKADRTEKEEPIDRDNHAIKALEYLLMDRFGPVNSKGRTKSERYIGNYGTESYIRMKYQGSYSWFE